MFAIQNYVVIEYRQLMPQAETPLISWHNLRLSALHLASSCTVVPVDTQTQTLNQQNHIQNALLAL